MVLMVCTASTQSRPYKEITNDDPCLCIQQETAEIEKSVNKSIGADFVVLEPRIVPIIELFIISTAPLFHILTKGKAHLQAYSMVLCTDVE